MAVFLTIGDLEKGPLPLKGFPPGKVRVRMRATDYVYVYIRPPEGGMRGFLVNEKGGYWVPDVEFASNRVVKNDANLSAVQGF